MKGFLILEYIKIFVLNGFLIIEVVWEDFKKVIYIFGGINGLK